MPDVKRAEQNRCLGWEEAKKIAAAALHSCPLHGRHDAADSGQPMSTRDRCERYRFP